MDFNAVCRTCLCTEFLNPIFKNKDHHSRFSAAMINTTGLKIELNDGLPQNICIECMAHINKSLKFRLQCKEAEKKLLKLMNYCEIDKIDELSDDEKDIKDPSNMEKQENVINNDVLSIKLETAYNLDDDKPLIHLFAKQNENLENFSNIKDKIDGIANLKNIIDKKDNSKNGNTYLDKNLNKESDCLSDIDINKPHLIELKKEGLNTNVKKRVTCRICKKSLSVRSVDTHMNKRHPGADERKIKCELCDTYVLRVKLNRHLRMMHGKDFTKCGYCKREFYTKESLVEHAPSCSDKKKKRSLNDAGKEMSECDICRKKMQKASLKMHQKIKHAGLGPICDHCGRKFGNKFRLNEHLRSKHGYEKYKCSQCDFLSASVLAMRNHERRHRGEKPYVCEVCGASFHAAYLLAQHRHSHRTSRLLKCDLCPASFKANNSLHMHKMACHSKATFKCTLCDRAYSCRQYAVKHMRSVHRYTGPVPNLERSPTT